MANLNDLTGGKFNSLTVIERTAAPRGRTEAYWLCMCDCGNTAIVQSNRLRRSLTKSCGCLATKKSNPSRIKHGYARTSEYMTWRNIRQRCEYEKAVNYEYYGGRGIEVCERWHNFENFIADMGLKPTPLHSIERKDNDGNYEPDNCEWALMSEQSKNKRSFGTVRNTRGNK